MANLTEPGKLPSKRSLLEHLCCLLLLAAIPLLALLPVVRGAVLPADLSELLSAPPWQEARPEGMTPGADPLRMLHATRYFPAYDYLSGALAEGRSVLWNPREGFGMPFLALWRTRVLSPFSLPFHFMPANTALAWSILLKFIVAGWCAFYAARRFHFPASLALFVAVCYQLGGTLWLFGIEPMADAAPWLPVFVVSLERLALGHLRAWPLMAAAVGLIALGGSPELLAVCLLFAVLYLLVRRVMDAGRVQLGNAAVGAVLALGFGLALAGVQLVPYLEFLTQGGWRDPVSDATLPWTALWSALSPDLASDGAALALHYGWSPMLLLALWAAVRRFVHAGHRRRMEGLFLVSLVLCIVPFVAGGALGSIPHLGMLGARHFFVFLGLGLPFLAAAALEEWSVLDADECRVVLRRLLPAALVLWGALLATSFTAMAWHEGERAAWLVPVAAGAAVAVTAALLIATLIRPRMRLLGYGFALLTALNLWWAFAPHAPHTRPELAFPETGFIRSLAAMDTMVAGADALQDWPLACQGIRQVRTTGGACLDRHEAFMTASRTQPLLLRRTGAQALLLDTAAVRGPFARVRHALKIHEMFPSGAVLMQDLDAQPRARMLYAARTVEGFQPELLSASEPPLVEGGQLAEDGQGPAATVRISDDGGGNVVRAEVEGARLGMLVLADAWYPGWKATVDGTPTPILPVDGIFRGVPLSLGAREVVFTYEPLSLRFGGIISIAAALIVGFNLLRGLWRPRAKR